MDQLDLLNELHLMQSQMNTMFKVLSPKKGNKDLLDAHNKAIESRKKKSDEDDSPNFSKKYLASQEKTNDYLARLIKTTQQVQFNRENTTLNPFHGDRKFSANPLNIMKNMGNFLEKDNNKGLTSALLKLPAGLLNFGKDIISKREIKKIDTGRKDLNINKEILEARKQQLIDLKKKHKEENPIGVENLTHLKAQLDLEEKIQKQKEKVISKTSEFATISEKLQYKNDLKLNKNKFKGIDKSDIEDIRKNNRRKMEESLLTDLEPKNRRNIRNRNNITEKNSNPLTVDTRRVTRSGILDEYGNPVSYSSSSKKVPNNQQSRVESFENAIKPLKGMNGDTSIYKTESSSSSILKHKVNVGPGTPSTFGDVVGGIYYRLGTIMENSGKKSELKESGGGGILGILGGLLGLVGSFLLSKFLPLGKMLSMLLHSGSKLGKVFSGLKFLGSGLGKVFKSIGTPITKVLEKIGLKAASKAVVGTGVKIAAEEGIKGAGKIALKVGGEEALKVGGKEALKIGGKGLLKSAAKKLPFLGLGAGALFAAQRAFGGDFKGAGLELASGATSLMPGAGTVAGLGIDAYLAKRDYDKATKGPEKISEKTPVREQVSPALQTESEVNRVKNSVEQSKILENAVYLGMKKYSMEDLQNNEQTRAKIYADANLNAGS